MTKAEVEAVKARAAWQFDLTRIVQQEPSDIQNLIADRERLIEVLKMFALSAAWNPEDDSSFDQMPNFPEMCAFTNELLREMGELP